MPTNTISSEHAHYTVRGRVVTSDGTPVLCTVHVWDHELRKRVKLNAPAGTPTGKAGEFEITYTSENLGRPAKVAADLAFTLQNIKNAGVKKSAPIHVTRIVRSERKIVEKPQIIFKAEAEETVEITIGKDAYRGPSEYEILLAVLTPYLGGTPPADIKRDAISEEIAILVNQSGQPRQRIEWLVGAHQLAQKTKLAPETCYALLRQGLPTELTLLLQQSPDVISHALRTAVRENAVPARYGEQIDQVIARIKQLALVQAFVPVGPDGFCLGALVALVLPNRNLQEEFLALYLDWKGKADDFWITVRKHRTLIKYADDLQFTFRVSELTRNHLPLVKELQRLHKAGEIPDISDLSHYDKGDWKKIIARRGVGFPADIKGDKDKESRYIETVSNRIERAFPTRFVFYRLKASRLPGDRYMAAFLEANPGFNIMTSRMGKYLNDNKNALAKIPEKHRDQTTNDFRILQRVYRIAMRYDQARELLKDNIHSAQAIVRMGRNYFSKKYEERLGTRAAAVRIHKRAQKVADTALHLAVEYGARSHRVSMKMVPDLTSADVRKSAVSGPGGSSARKSSASGEATDRSAPDWFTLFGSLEQCECSSCLSVHGPAAYLVDVLHFLANRDSRMEDRSAKDILFLRRPDIGEIELTCNNTNTPMPYVDLVNEALENAVSPPAAFEPFELPSDVEADLNERRISDSLRSEFSDNAHPLSADAVITVGSEGRPWSTEPHWWTIDEPAHTYTIRKEREEDGTFTLRVVARGRQTKGSDAERSANPQYINEEAYGKLKLSESVYPWSLPFDLWSEEARAYLVHLGVPRWQIMESLGLPPRRSVLTGHTLAHEHLGLTEVQADIITRESDSTAAPELWKHWGFEKASLDAETSIPDPSDSTRRIASGEWLDVLTGRVDVFLQQSGLKYKEMLDLLDTYYVNPVRVDPDEGPTRTIHIVSSDKDKPDTCVTDQLHLDGMDQLAAGRIVGFVRLWRALGWSMRDLDRAITAFKPERLGDDFLVCLSHVKRLNAGVDIPVSRLLSWWSYLDTSLYIDHSAPGQPRAASVYDQLFRNRSTINPPNPAFTERPEDLRGAVMDHAATVSAALGISEADLAVLLRNVAIIPRQTVTAPITGSKVELTAGYQRCWVALDLGKVTNPDNQFTLLIQESNDDITYTDIPDAELAGEGQPPVIGADNDESIIRRLYRGTAKYIRASVTDVQGADPGLELAVHVEYAYCKDLSNELNIANLSQLHRIASLAKGVRLSIRDLLTVATLTDIDPFATTTDSILFVEAVEKIRKSKFSIGELDYLLRHSFAPDVAAAAPDEAIATFLSDLRADLQKIATDNTFRDEAPTGAGGGEYDAAAPTRDLDGSLTRQKLALLNWDAAWIEEIISTLNGSMVYEEPLGQGDVPVSLPNATGIYAVDLGVLPANAIPAGLGDAVTYSAGQLKASRFLGTRERELLRNNANAIDDQPFRVALADLFKLHDELCGTISYSDGYLRFAGPMTKARKARLDAVSENAEYKTAVVHLFEAPRNLIMGAMRTFGVRYFTADLAALPDEVKFPTALRNKVYYDDRVDPTAPSATGKLHCVGVLTGKERDTLLGLSDNSDYHTAINKLYDAPRVDSTDLTLFMEDIAVGTIFNSPNTAGDIADPLKSSNERFLIVLKKLLHHLREALSEQHVVQKMAEALRIELRAADTLLRKLRVDTTIVDPKRFLGEFLDSGYINSQVAISAAAFPAQFTTYLRLHKAGMLVERFKLTFLQLGWILDELSIGWLNLDQLPITAADPPADFDAWRRLQDMVDLRDSLQQGEKALGEIFECARSCARLEGTDVTDENKNRSKKTWTESVMRWTRWTDSDLEALIGAADDHAKMGLFNAPFPESFADELILMRLRDIFKIGKRLGVSVQSLSSLASGNVTQAIARAVREAVRAKYDEAQWLNIAKPLHDVLREKQRAALVAWLVAHLKLEYPKSLRDANDLYAHFLLDVEMSPCMMTSRIKQAISSVQLFVQRCLMNLERNVAAEAEIDEKWLEWKWMKNYRVWEANRKIFLYPENWIEPELRDDKSPFFNDLESELLQSDLTKELAEEAFIHYLEKLDQVAHLEVVGITHQVEGDDIDILHVFARTAGTPHVYFYRQRVIPNNSTVAAYWTAWEQLDMNIEGEHLIPAVWNRRLYLFWPIFTEKALPIDIALSGGELSGGTLRKYREIQISWGERKQGIWVSKHIASRVTQIVDIDIYPPNFQPSDLFFRTKIDAQNKKYILALHPSRDESCAFRFDEPQLEPRITREDYVHIQSYKLSGAEFDQMFLYMTSSGTLYLPIPNDDTILINGLLSTIALQKTTGERFYILPSPQGYADRIQYHPFFCWDTTRVFIVERQRTTGYIFQLFYHPYANAFVRQISRYGIEELMKRELQMDPENFALVTPGGSRVPPLDFSDYDPTEVVAEDHPKEDVDFTLKGAYALYNWELFFHAPLLIADRLSKNQRYEEAQKWFHYIFNPTDTSSDESKGEVAPQRYWQTKPLFELTQYGVNIRQRIENILWLLAEGADPSRFANLSDQEKKDYEQFKASVGLWRSDPFKPHLIARMRNTAFQKTVVMKYIDNLIAWGDQLFRRDTIESINEATQLYILAAEILGRRPEEIPPRALPRVQTYNSLESQGLDPFSNVLAQIEEFIPPSAGDEEVETPVGGGPTTGPPVGGPGSTPVGGGPGTEPPVEGPGSTPVGGGPTTQPPVAPTPTLPMLYFCISKNDKLLGYWDTVADRLFKIRHCMNIEGVVRQLPLFEPPIDPAVLVRAVAAGVDLSSALSDISGAMSHYRFNVIAQKAAEVCSEVKALGQTMLSALEKRDAEKISLIRAQHETALLALVEEVRKLQNDEAEQNKKALSASRESAVTRYLHYQRMLGVQSPQVPGIGEAIAEASASANIAIEEESGTKIIPHEKAEMKELKDSANDQDKASDWEFAASIANIVPNFNISPFGVGTSIGGSNVGSAFTAIANRKHAAAAKHSYDSGRSGKLGQYALRAHDWLLQSNLAAREIMQIDQQYLAADLRSQIAQKELANHRRQMENARTIEESLRDKYTNEELYGWMIGQLATVHFQSYQLAYDLAKRAERAYRFELGIPSSDYIKFGYWDNLKKGLLAGEKLFLDIKRMEAAYYEKNKREYEITKHVSLALLDPLALMQLRQSGQCVVDIPEVLYDLDFPGHYMRRIKTVSLSIPCITGPYSGVHCTLRLLRSSVRHGDTLLGGNKYARGEADPRFTDQFGAIESVATSSGQNDSGLFELNFRDERYLPFEGAGAISTWQLELPTVFRQFDYSTISDVILHIRYTAREGGALLREGAQIALSEALNAVVQRVGETGLYAAFNLRQEFPSEWQKLKTDKTVKLKIGSDRLPYYVQKSTVAISESRWFAKLSGDLLLDYGMKLERLNVTPNWTQDFKFEPSTTIAGIYEAKERPSISLGTEYALSADSTTELETLVLVIKYTFN